MSLAFCASFIKIVTLLLPTLTKLPINVIFNHTSLVVKRILSYFGHLSVVVGIDFEIKNYRIGGEDGRRCVSASFF